MVNISVAKPISTPNISVIDKPNTDNINVAKPTPTPRVSVLPTPKKRKPIRVSLMDIFREVPGAVPETLRRARGFTAEIARIPIKALIKTGLPVAQGITSLVTGKQVPNEFVASTPLQKFLFGEQPIKSIFTEEEEVQEFIKAQGGSQAQAIAGASIFVAGLVGLDLSPFGGSEKAGAAVIKRLGTKYGDEIVEKIIKVIDPKKLADAFNKGDDIAERFIRNNIERIQKGDKAFLRGIEKDIGKEIRQAKIKQEAITNIDKQHGTTEVIINRLEKKGLTVGEIDNIFLEDGTKLVDTVKIKRGAENTLSAIIRKSDLDSISKSYTGKIPVEKWVKTRSLQNVLDAPKNLARIYELPAVFFEKKGLKMQIFDPIIDSIRGAEELKNSYLNRFKRAKLFKEGGWFTADRFLISAREAKEIGQYYLSRQGRGLRVGFDQLGAKSQKFVNLFDDIIKETEPRFFEVAKKNNKTPGKVKNYAPIMTREDIKLIDQGGEMDFIVRKHPAFFSLKERAKKVPVGLYEKDYRKVAARWLDGVTKFNTVGEVAPEIKYLIDSKEFQKLINRNDLAVIRTWFKDSLHAITPATQSQQAVQEAGRFLRKTSAIASLGLNYASVLKQVLTQIPLAILEKAPPKLYSKYAKAFGISVGDLPAITSRKGNIAIVDLQGKFGRIFTGSLTKFDKTNAQVSLNRLLDKEYKKILKEGKPITPDTHAFIQRSAQDLLDLYYGGMAMAQRPEAFRSEVGKFVNMFIYPLTSQLNGFYRHIYQAKGAKNAVAIAEVAAAATSIAYMEQVISNLSLKWSDEVQMTKDVMQSLAGNVPVASQIVYAFATDQQLQVSAGVSGISKLLKTIGRTMDGTSDITDLSFATAEVLGLPKQIRKIHEGMEIIEEGGIRDKNGKMLAPVMETSELMRSILRGKYGSKAAQDWIRNIATKKDKRRWFVPQVEFLQNGDYNRKAELYNSFNMLERLELRSYLSEAQQKKLDKALKDIGGPKKSLGDVFGDKKDSLNEIFK